jgi:hypothetical protein
VNNPVRFHPLSFVPERNEGEVLVGRPDSESFAVFEADDAALLERMVNGVPPAEAAAWYQATYGLAVDMPDFLDLLTGLGFVRGEGDEGASPGPVRLQWLGKVMFSRFAFGALVAVTVCWLVVISRHPELAPNPRQVFFTNSIVLVQLAVLFLQLPWIALHEGAHVLAGRRLGLPSRLGVGTRLYFVVFETHLNGLLTVPRRKRYTPILAGMAVDVFVISGFGLLAFAMTGPGGQQPFAARLLLAMAFPILVRLGYQFLLFLQTDVYFVVATALGCHDLHAAAKAMIYNRVWRVLKRPDRIVDEDEWTARDRQVAGWYGPLFLVGAAVLITIGIVVVIPILMRVAHLFVQDLGLSPFQARFWDSVLFAILNLTQFFLYGTVAVRNRMRARRSGGQAASAAPVKVTGRTEATFD